MQTDAKLFNESIFVDTKNKVDAAHIYKNKSFDEHLVNYENIAEMFLSQVEKNADKVYLTYRNNEERLEFTYKEILLNSFKLATFMYQELGVRAGDRISTVAYNHYRTVIVYYASLLLGAVLVPINIGDSDERIQYVQNNSESKVVFVMPDLLERYNKIKPEIKSAQFFFHMGSTLFAGEESKQASDYLDLDILLSGKRFDVDVNQLVEKASLFADHADLENEALIVYTSGTTGDPKGVVLDQYNILVNAHFTGKALNYTHSDRMMIVLPIHHVNGLVVSLITSMYYGASVVLNRKFSSNNYWSIASEEKATCGSVVPTVLAFLCEKNSDGGLQDKKDSSSKSVTEKASRDNDFSNQIKNLAKNFYLICGAGPLTVDLVKKFNNTYGIKLIHGYGLSETTAFNCFIPVDMSDEERNEWLSKYGYPCIGTEIECNEMNIHNEDGIELAPEERGEIVIRGHDVMKFYYKNPEANAEVFKHGWFRTGDEGFYKRDSSNRKEFFITGRIKEIIIRGGVNHSTFEIDEILNEIPEVKSAMAVGFENDYYGEEIGAYVVLQNTAKISEEEASKKILLHCKAKLPFVKCPKAVVFGEEFPVTATGKYQRNKLKPLFAKYKSVQFKQEK